MRSGGERQRSQREAQDMHDATWTQKEAEAKRLLQEAEAEQLRSQGRRKFLS